MDVYIVTHVQSVPNMFQVQYIPNTCTFIYIYCRFLLQMCLYHTSKKQLITLLPKSHVELKCNNFTPRVIAITKSIMIRQPEEESMKLQLMPIKQGEFYPLYSNF